MSERYIAKSSWSGVEGRITRGQVFTPLNDKRARELVQSGRAEKATKPEETKGGPVADDASEEKAETKATPARRQRKGRKPSTRNTQSEG